MSSQPATVANKPPGKPKYEWVNPASPEAVLSKSQANREVIQDFVPLAESLEWELGQQYLRERGNKAFISDASPVPFVINNDGTFWMPLTDFTSRFWGISYEQ